MPSVNVSLFCDFFFSIPVIQSEVGPLSQSLSLAAEGLNVDMLEEKRTETVYTGYANSRRVCFPGLHPHPAGIATQGRVESKRKAMQVDLNFPAALYDVRISMSEEQLVEHQILSVPNGWSSKRVKRRRSYRRRDNQNVWRIDVTEVTTTFAGNNQPPKHTYEIELELQKDEMRNILKEKDPARLQQLTTRCAVHLQQILTQLNPLVLHVVDAGETLRDHPDQKATALAKAQCVAMKKFLDSSADVAAYESGRPGPPKNVKFMGCMPINFSRHNIEEVQRSPDNGYFLSEKTDGVRHLMVFTGNTVVLLARDMKGKQPKPVGRSTVDPMGHFVKLIKPGAVFDGEVVIHRGRPGTNDQPRPIFIVFDVLAISFDEPILHLPFAERYKHLKRATFRTPHCAKDMFDAKLVFDASIALPLVRKNFVGRADLDCLMRHVKVEKGVRIYRNGNLHSHKTDGIIFQPNLPYVCGTDHQLLKWKYLDTVTIDVEILTARRHDKRNALRLVVTGDGGSAVDMTRHIRLPHSELCRLEADRMESGVRIAEVGFNPETGGWYYLTMRPDKSGPNHISTVLGTVLELAESLSAQELRYRMSVPSDVRDTYRLDSRRALEGMIVPTEN